MQSNGVQKVVVLDLCLSAALDPKGNTGGVRGSCPEFVTFEGVSYSYHHRQTPQVPSGPGYECGGK